MSNGDGRSYHSDFFRWLKIHLKNKGLQPTLCGFKNKELTSEHAVDPASGGWAKPSYSQSKPIRWLFNIRRDGGTIVAAPASAGMANIGFHSSGQGNKAALAVRILPVIETGPGTFESADDMEVYAVFAFKNPIEAGGNADPSAFDPATGEMQHRVQGQKAAHHQPYIFAGLLGIKPRSDAAQITMGGAQHSLSYGEVVDALAAAITAAPDGGAAGPIPVYDLSQKSELERLTQDVETAYKKAGPPVKPAATVAAAEDGDDDSDEDDEGEAVSLADIEISEDPDLVGVDPAVYRQINAALRSGKQHIMFYGPPGTGKTTLARWVATSLNGAKWTMITGSADWSSQDIIGGYQPVGSCRVALNSEMRRV